MQSLTIGASSLIVAQRLHGALSEFQPEVLDGDDGAYQVTVSLREGDSEILAILDALERHVTERQSAARVQLNGHSYVLQPN
jgi:hypothetical protein